MDWLEKPENIAAFIKKYKWVILIFLTGLLLMAIPEKSKTSETIVVEQIEKEDDLELQLEELLSKLDGAGKVKVLLTLESGERTYYQTDENISNNPNAIDQRMDTVIITDVNRSQHGLIQQIDAARYRGAVILCQGGNNATIRLAVVEAVKTATGLTSDKISVLKMK